MRSPRRAWAARSKSFPEIRSSTLSTRPISGIGIGLLGAKKSVVSDNSVLSNRPSKPAPFAGGITVASTKSFGGSDASHNLIAKNHALKNKPADVVWDGRGNGNKFQRNRCSTSLPAGLCH